MYPEVAPTPVHYTWSFNDLVSSPPGATIRIEPVLADEKCTAECTITFDGETAIRLTIHDPADADLDEEARGVCAAIYWSRMRSLAGSPGDYSRDPDPNDEMSRP